MKAFQLQVIVSKLYSLLFGEKFVDPSFGKYFVDFFFPYDETVTIASRLIFAFAIFALHISNILMVQNEELFIKSPKLQLNHAHCSKIKSRSF